MQTLITQQDLEPQPQDGIATITSAPAAPTAPATDAPPAGLTHNQLLQWQRDRAAQQNAQTIADREAERVAAAGGERAPAPAPTPAPPPAPTTSPQDMPGQRPVDWGGSKPEHLGQMPASMPGPQEWKVTEEQLVEGRMKDLYAKQAENPLFADMRQAVIRAHAARGGQNSLMANSAAEGMIVDTIFKIAQTDAQTVARSAEFNAMAQNQFSLANQQFMQQAMLSEQNFKQAMAVQEAANQAALSAAAAYASAAADEDARWKERNQITHSQTLEIIQLQHGNTLQRDEILFGYDLAGDTHRTDNAIRRDTAAASLQYSANWNLAEQAAGHQAERDEQLFGQQLALGYQSEAGANTRALIGTIGQIGSTEGLTPAQQAAAIGQMTALYEAQNNMLSAFYTAHTPRSAGAGSGTPGQGGVQRPDYLRYNAAPLTQTQLPAPSGGGKSLTPVQALTSSLLSPRGGAAAGLDRTSAGAGGRILTYEDLGLQ